MKCIRSNFTKSHVTWLGFVALASLWACSTESQVVCDENCDVHDFGEASQAIVNGDLSDDKQVVALAYQGQQFCSGTVVGKRTIVTAAHCLPPNIDVPMLDIEVFFGADASGVGSFYGVVDGLANPAWNLDLVPGDVGVLALAQDAPVAAMPLAYLDVGAAGVVGTQVRAVGFGITEVEGGGSGVRRTGMLMVDSFDASSFFLTPGPSATCNGDSGGALIFIQDGVEVLGGIHSRSDCGSSIIAERVDVHAMDFIMPFLEEHEGAASCDADGMCASGCDTPDPDCLCAPDGFCDDSCTQQSADVDCSADAICDESRPNDPNCPGVLPDVCAVGSDSCVVTGGCSTTGGGSSAWFALGMLVLLFRRRRLAKILNDRICVWFLALKLLLRSEN